MEARDNSFDLATIHKPRQQQQQQHPLTGQHTLTQQEPQLFHPSAPSFLARQRSGQRWLSSSSSSSFSMSTTAPPPREHYPLRHQPMSYPQARPHTQHPHTYTHSFAPATRSHHHEHQRSTSFVNPAYSKGGDNRNRIRATGSALDDHDDWSSSSFSKIEAVTHGIRNKIIVEEDEEDIQSTDRFY
ncbi:uncharacterized protein LOC6566765 [Drosophila grimshawi]|uniref:uncharacterized protein LOC6566765 n=1 Tax=Drosophila grimshawi TaxID=7222 RepID=UPI000C870F59|nr:uncharacterized protein LOC6566765 [Drosophila grimshawi]